MVRRGDPGENGNEVGINLSKGSSIGKGWRGEAVWSFRNTLSHFKDWRLEVEGK